MATRKLVTALIVGVLALVGSTACRSQIGTAAYVGDIQITDKNVEEVIDSVRSEIPQERFGDIRQTIVTMLVLTEAGKQYAKAEGISIPAGDPRELAQQNQIAADTKYAVLAANFLATMRVLADKAVPADPDDNDQREAYANLDTNGQQVPPFDQVRSYFNAEAMAASIGQRNMLNEVVKRSDVRVSPRYSPLTYQIPMQVGGVPTWVGVRLSGDPSSDAVVERG